MTIDESKINVSQKIEMLQARNARVTINAVHPGIVKTGIIRAHDGFITGTIIIHLKDFIFFCKK